MYNPFDMDYTLIKLKELLNMEYLELNRSIREAKTNFILAKTEEEATYYKEILRDLRREKQELLNNAF